MNERINEWLMNKWIKGLMKGWIKWKDKLRDERIEGWINE